MSEGGRRPVIGPVGGEERFPRGEVLLGWQVPHLDAWGRLPRILGRGVLLRPGRKEGSYLRLVDFCITQL